MTRYIQEITLDVFKASRVTINAKQGDGESHFVRVRIEANGTQVKPDAGVTAVFRMRKDDGHSIFDAATIEEDGRVLVKLTRQALARHGVHPADVSLMQNEEVLSTVTFFLQVGEAPVGDNLDSADELLALVEATAAANRATAAANEAAEATRAATEAANKATAAANEAEAARAKAEAARVTAETARASEEQKRASAETARAQDETARKAAETARETAETKRAQDMAKAIKDAEAATERANAAAALVEGGVEELVITDEDDSKRWATKMYIRSGHLVMVSEEKTA